MPISDNMTVWGGKLIVDWAVDSSIEDPGGTAYRIRIGYDDGEEGVTWPDRFAAFLEAPGAGELTALVVGNWDPEYSELDSTAVVEAITSAAESLPNLTALFLGDITYEENEISWIRQSDLSPIFNAYPNLEHFGVRGSTGLSLGNPRLPKLTTLVIESGGLPLSVIEEVFDAELPVLEHLELWLGDGGYGAEASVDNLSPILGEDAPKKWPRLRHLGLRDSEIADEVATALANAPILRQLEALDLSLGALGDDGAVALAASKNISGLKQLDIHHHFVSAEVVESLKILGIEVDADDPQTAEAFNGGSIRYVAVGE